QVSNNSSEAIGRMTIAWDQSHAQSTGIFVTPNGFFDAGGPITSAHPLGVPAPPSSPPGSFSPWSGTGAPTSLNGLGLVVPTSLVTQPTVFGSNFGNTIPNGQVSFLFGFTSDLSPIIVHDSLQDGVAANGNGPSMATPEPTTAALLLVAVPAVGLLV